ncbi:MAG: hypothetical protein ACLQD9_00485 [Thermoplasmata archaeon]
MTEEARVRPLRRALFGAVYAYTGCAFALLLLMETGHLSANPLQLLALAVSAVLILCLMTLFPPLARRLKEPM